MNDTTVIPQCTQRNISSVNLRLWSRMQRFILLNPLLFALNIVIKDLFVVNSNDILEKWINYLIWKKTCCYGYAIVLILLTKSMKNFFLAFSSGGRLWIGLCCGQVLILKYFCVSFIAPIFSKHLDRSLMSVIICVHLSMVYCQNETLKTSFGLGGQ